MWQWMDRHARLLTWIDRAAWVLIWVMVVLFAWFFFGIPIRDIFIAASS